MSAAAQPSVLQEGAEAFLARYAAVKRRLPGDAARREAAAAAFAQGGLPSPREEAWRYTNLRPLAELAYADAPAAVDTAALLARLPDIAAPRLVFVNGAFHAGLSSIPGHITVRTGQPAFGQPAFGDTVAEEKLACLNTMLSEDGAAIEVAAGIEAGMLVLVHLASDGGGAPPACHPRHSLRIGAGASLTLVQLAIGEGVYLHNEASTIRVEEGAALAHLRIQDEAAGAFHTSTVRAEIAAGGTYDSFALTLGARLARMDVHARLAGERAIAHLNAAQLLGGAQHADFTTVVAHDAPHTASRQTVKNVLTGRARGVFQGKIEVARAAQKTDGYQMSQALLLSPEAEIDCKPQLEIYADDVKCSHGATVGALDADQLFYLRSRGVPEAMARTMLVRAFLAEALDPIASDTARHAMEAAIDGWWRRQTP
ncbi:MAG: Fe-S cluster assembly protein SufD [Rhodospirillales bacterium]|nr:Fe-S cluster assembly protein SufD [Rhodospirillales bacterium]